MTISILRNQSSGLDKPKLSAEQLQRINSSLNQTTDTSTTDTADSPAYIVELSHTASQQTSARQVQTVQTSGTTNASTDTDTSYHESPAYIVELSATALALQKQRLDPEQDQTKSASKTLIAQL